MNAYNEVIKQLMEAQGIKQKELSELLNLSQPSIHQRLGSEKTFPIEDLIVICSTLNISITDLITMARKLESEPTIEAPWTIRKCSCGHPNCEDYFLSFTRSDGRMTKRQALLAAAAPKMLSALKAVIEFQEHVSGHSFDPKVNKMRIGLRDIVREAMYEAEQK